MGNNRATVQELSHSACISKLFSFFGTECWGVSG